MPHPFDLDDLAAFAAVARTGGISAAARALNTVQSAVTARIQAMEARLGARLFERHARGVALTEAGARLLPHAQAIARQIADARAAVLGQRGGRLAIGTMETTAAARLPPLLARFRADWPDAELRIQADTTAALVEAVLGRDLDGAFVAGPIRNPALAVHPAFEEELLLLTAPHRGGLAALRDVETSPPILVFRAGCAYRQRLEAILVAAGRPDLRRIEFGTWDGILGCVAADVGIALVPRVALERAGGLRVRAHPLPVRHARIATVFIHRRDRADLPALMGFIRCLRPGGDRAELSVAAE
ncbi:LysR family transcriptional regulator [Leptolyngbya sp. 15MV]|nr:LysR family transcriptional regulator [Leptolyngbya sp. 15MV]